MTQPDTTHSRDYIILKGRVGEAYARELVVASAIDPTVALERGYWVAMNRLDLKPLAFTRIYRVIDVPALVLPRRSPDGATTRYQIKPRVPMQTEWGKYLFPPHEEMIVDVVVLVLVSATPVRLDFGTMTHEVVLDLMHAELPTQDAEQVALRSIDLEVIGPGAGEHSRV